MFNTLKNSTLTHIPVEEHCRKVAISVYNSINFETIVNNKDCIHPLGNEMQNKIAREEIEIFDSEYAIIRSSNHTNSYFLVLTKYNDMFYQVYASNLGNTLYYSFKECIGF